jgi:hypothetical protein
MEHRMTDEEIRRVEREAKLVQYHADRAAESLADFNNLCVKLCARPEKFLKYIQLTFPQSFDGGTAMGSQPDSNQYSLARLFRSAMPGETEQATFEHETSRQLVNRLKHNTSQRAFAQLDPQGDLVPFAEIFRRDITAGNAPSLVSVETLPDVWSVGLVGPSRVLDAAGALTIFTTAGSLHLGSGISGPAPEAVTEGTAPTEGTATVGRILATPREVVTYLDVSRKLLKAQGVESYIRALVQNGIEAKVEALVFSGAGGDEPTGIVNVNSVGTFSGVDFAGTVITDAMGDLAEAGANPQRASWILGTTPFVVLSNRDADAALGNKLLRDDKLASRQAFCSPNVGVATAIFGEWARLVVVVFGGGVDIIVNPYKLDKEGLVRITCRMFVDVAVLEPTAFTYCTDFS